MFKNITEKELKKGTTFLAFDRNDNESERLEIELSFSKKLNKFGIIKDGVLVKTSKTLMPSFSEFKWQVTLNELNTIKRFD